MHSTPLPLPILPPVRAGTWAGEGRQEKCWHESNPGYGLAIIEERWKQLSCNNLCYVARMEVGEEREVGEGGGRSRGVRRRSSVSLSPLARWV